MRQRRTAIKDSLFIIKFKLLFTNQYYLFCAKIQTSFKILQISKDIFKKNPPNFTARRVGDN